MGADTREALTPERIGRDYRSGRVSKAEAFKLLSVLIETSENAKIRMEAIKIAGELNTSSEKVFKVLENSLISDEDPSVRAAAAHALTSCCPSKGLTPLRWSIQNEKSPMVITTILELSETTDDPQIKLLKDDLLRRLSSVYGVVPCEAKFFLDLQVINKHPQIGDFISEGRKRSFRESDRQICDELVYAHYCYCSAFMREKGRVILLNTNVWKVPDSIGSLSKLKYLYIYNAKKIPGSVGSLRNLEILRINDYVRINDYKKVSNPFLRIVYLKSELGSMKKSRIRLPENLVKLKKLKKLCLDYKNFYPVSETVKTLVEQNIAKYYVQEGVRPDEAFTLGLIEVFLWEECENMEESKRLSREGPYPPQPAYSYVVTIGYKSDERGHVVSLSISGADDFDLEVIPDPIFSLKYLKKLKIHGAYVREIPDKISELKSLRVLDLYYNCIRTIPESIKSLKSLEVLDLHENCFKRFPEEVTSIASLKHLSLSNYEIKEPFLEIPESISRLKNLEKLSIPMQQIKKVPESIKSLKSLKNLSYYINYTNKDILKKK